MRITIGTPERQIPHIIHGISANTLFYLINYEKYILNRAYDSNREIKYRPACGYGKSYGYVSHNPAAGCKYFEERK